MVRVSLLYCGEEIIPKSTASLFLPSPLDILRPEYSEKSKEYSAVNGPFTEDIMERFTNMGMARLFISR
jgi:hypothetical protein